MKALLSFRRNLPVAGIEEGEEVKAHFLLFIKAYSGFFLDQPLFCLCVSESHGSLYRYQRGLTVFLSRWNWKETRWYYSPRRKSRLLCVSGEQLSSWLSLHHHSGDSECWVPCFSIFISLLCSLILVECAPLNDFALILEGVWCCQFLSLSPFGGVMLSCFLAFPLLAYPSAYLVYEASSK